VGSPPFFQLHTDRALPQPEPQRAPQQVARLRGGLDAPHLLIVGMKPACNKGSRHVPFSNSHCAYGQHGIQGTTFMELDGSWGKYMDGTALTP
jgi:hypothetical protein